MSKNFFIISGHWSVIFGAEEEKKSLEAVPQNVSSPVSFFPESP